MKKIIFLSYRRNDSPGYVNRLEHDLELAFGQDRVFRDVNDIKGGSDWKKVINKNLENAGVLLLVMGPRWGTIWKQSKDHSSDYLVYEIEKARELGVPIITVTLNGNTLSAISDLGQIDWLRDKQTYDMSDHQKRWPTDFNGLVRLLEDYNAIGKRISNKWNWKYIVVSVVALIPLLMFILATPTTNSTLSSTTSSTVTSTPAPTPDLVLSQTITPNPNPTLVNLPIPNIAGKWIGTDGSIYSIEQFSNASFNFESPDYGSGYGEFIADMPNKFRVEIKGIGYGEFSVSTGGQEIIGWFIEESSMEKEYMTLSKFE